MVASCNREIIIIYKINRSRSKWRRNETWLSELPWKLSFIAFRAWSYGEIFMDAYTCSHIRSVLCLAALLTLNFAAPFLCRTHLRTVRYASLYRLLFRTSGLGCVPIIPDTWISLILVARILQSSYGTNRKGFRGETNVFLTMHSIYLS